MSRYKVQNMIADLDRLILATILSLLICCSCKKKDQFPLDKIFNKVEENVSPNSILVQFKNMPMDSAILHYNEFPEILPMALRKYLKKVQIDKYL